MPSWGSVFVSYTADVAVSQHRLLKTALDAAVRVGLRPVMGISDADPLRPTPAPNAQVGNCDVHIALAGLNYQRQTSVGTTESTLLEANIEAASKSGIPQIVVMLNERLLPKTQSGNRSRKESLRQTLERRVGVSLHELDSTSELAETLVHSLYEVRAARGLTESLPAIDSSDDADATPYRRPWMAPPLDSMVERQHLGNQLISALVNPAAMDVGLTTGLRGAGGFGKTRLATWSVHHDAVRKRFPGGLLWTTLGQDIHGADLADKINDLSFVLTRERPPISDPDSAGAELGRLIDDNGKPILLVIDDVWQESQLRPFRIGGRSCIRLVTTRIPDLLPPGGKHIAVDAMSTDESLELLKLGLNDLNKDVANALVKIAGNWPVLLNLINRAVRYRVDRGQNVQEAAAEVAARLRADGPAALDSTRNADRAKAVQATVAASLSLLGIRDRENYLDLAIFPEDVEIPLSALQYLWRENEVEALCDLLFNLGLIADYRLDFGNPRLVLHDVLRAYIIARRGENERRQTHARFLENAGASFKLQEGISWWKLPTDQAYLWRFVPYHLSEAGLLSELHTLVTDLRWVEGKTHRLGSVVTSIADLQLIGEDGRLLSQVLKQSARTLGPIEPASALGATLASRIHGIPQLTETLEKYQQTLPYPRMEPAWKLPDQTRPGVSDSGQGHTGAITSCVFSRDGSMLATSSDDGTARLLEFPTFRHIQTLDGHTGGLWDCSFSPDNRLFATASEDRTARVWSIADGSIISVLAGHSKPLSGCGFSPDGRFLATASQDGTARLWDYEKGVTTSILKAQGDGARGWAFSPDGSTIALAASDGVVRILNTFDGSLVLQLSGHADWVRGCAFSPDGRLLATASADRTIRLWSARRGVEVGVLQGHTGGVWGCAFSPDGSILSSVGSDGIVRLWNVSSLQEVSQLRGHTAWVRACAFSTDGQLLVTAGHDGARVWDWSSGRAIHVIAGDAKRVNGGAFSPDGELIATVNNDSKVLIQKVDGIEVTTLQGHVGRVYACAFLSDGHLLVTTGNDQTVRLWDTSIWRPAAVCEGHKSWVRGVAFSPKGNFFATTSTDSTVRVWRRADFTCMHVLKHEEWVQYCAFSPDGRRLATAGHEHELRIWDVVEGHTIAVLAGHNDWVTGCDYSPDGSILASTSDDQTIKLWATDNYSLAGTLEGHSSWAEGCAFSPDGRFLASVSNDRTIRIWDVAESMCVAALRVAAPLSGVRWHPSGRMLLAVGGSGAYLLRFLTSKSK